MADGHFQRMLEGFSLTTAEILYHLPDHPALVQTYLWQEYDVAPKFPKLVKFLTFWRLNLDGKLKQVRVAHHSLITPAEIKFVDAEFKLS